MVDNSIDITFIYTNSEEESENLKVEKDIEEELIYLNANLRLLKGFIDAIEQSESELVDLRAAEF